MRGIWFCTGNDSVCITTRAPIIVLHPALICEAGESGVVVCGGFGGERGKRDIECAVWRTGPHYIRLKLCRTKAPSMIVLRIVK